MAHVLIKDYQLGNVKVLAGSDIEVDGAKLTALQNAGFLKKPVKKTSKKAETKVAEPKTKPNLK